MRGESVNPVYTKVFTPLAYDVKIHRFTNTLMCVICSGTQRYTTALLGKSGGGGICTRNPAREVVLKTTAFADFATPPDEGPAMAVKTTAGMLCLAE